MVVANASPVVVTPPTVEPVSLDEAKLAARVLHNGLDLLIAGLIKAGRQRCERVAELALVSQTLLLAFDGWPCGGEIMLLRPPLVSVSSVKYVDAITGVLTTLATDQYVVSSTRWPTVITPAYGVVWPSVRCQPESVQIRYVAGYGATAASVPAEIRERIKVYVAYCLDHQGELDEDYCDRIFAGFWSGTY